MITMMVALPFDHSRLLLLPQKTTMNYTTLLTVMVKMLEWLSSWWMTCWTTRAQHKTLESLLQLTCTLAWPQHLYCMLPNK